ncbi:MAG: hypothetical protein RL077_1432 [Verrucomicrobiota bacterium]
MTSWDQATCRHVLLIGPSSQKKTLGVPPLPFPGLPRADPAAPPPAITYRYSDSNCSGRFPAITRTYHLWRGDQSGPHSPLCGSESENAPSAQRTVRTTFADSRVRRHSLGSVGKVRINARSPPPPNSQPGITLLSSLGEGYSPSSVRVQHKIPLSSRNLRVHRQLFPP